MSELIYRFMDTDVSMSLKTPDLYKISRTQYKPLSPDRIIGIDTESIIRSDRLIFKYLQLFSNEHTLLHDHEQTEEDILSFLFTWLIDHFGESYNYPSDITERAKDERASRKGKADGRDGRKKYITPVILAFFNLQYDLGRLIDDNALFRRIIGYGSDSFKFQYGRFSIEIIYSCIGVACPSFKWLIVDSENRKAVSIVGFDGTSFFKSSLAEVTRQLNLTSKIDLEEDKDLFTRDWDTKPPTPEQLKRFEEYSLNDSRCHKEIYDVLVQLLSRIDPAIFDKTGIIPLSAPSASAKIMLHLCEKDEFKPPSLRVQQLGLDAYKGAISFCVSPGYCTNISVKDISSAYPHVMTLLPDFSTVIYRELAPVSKTKLTKIIQEWSLQYKEGNPIFGVVEADFQALDSLYPIAVTYADSKQLGIYGKCYRTIITIPELMIAYNSGRCSISRIHQGIILIGSNQSSPLLKFVETCYNLKAEAKVKGDEPMYLLAKLLMNSLYGKLIEKRHTNHIIRNFHQDTESDDAFILEVPHVKEKPYKKAVLDVYLQLGEVEACEHAAKIAYELYKDKWTDYILLSDLLQEEHWHTGYYFNALYAAQITGFTRAKLMAASHYCKALAGDTDSIFIPDGADKGLEDHLNSIGAITPITGLGSFETELSHASGLILKKKQYYLETTSKLKIAHHAIQSVQGKSKIEEAKEKLLSQNKTQEEITRSIGGLAMKLQIREYLETLYKRGEISYTTKDKPISLIDGIKNNRVLGKFVSKEVKILYKKMSEYQEIKEGKIYWKESLIFQNRRKES